jgi:hypothetical protein
MTQRPVNLPIAPRTDRAGQLLTEHRRRIFRVTDRLFAGLLVAQWLTCIAIALWVSPQSWAGRASFTHPHVWAAVCLGGIVISVPTLLALFRPGTTVTRHAVGVAQALVGVLLIHLTGGRLETHFHVFASLALLAFYRDWSVLVTASVVIASDHFFRGLYWPQSAYGVAGGAEWRWLEHAGWVIVEDAFLI